MRRSNQLSYESVPRQTWLPSLTRYGRDDSRTLRIRSGQASNPAPRTGLESFSVKAGSGPWPALNVRTRGLEPPTLTGYAPQAYAYTNSATSAICATSNMATEFESVPKVGVEPTIPYGNAALNDTRIPVPPLRRTKPILSHFLLTPNFPHAKLFVVAHV